MPAALLPQFQQQVVAVQRQTTHILAPKNRRTIRPFSGMRGHVQTSARLPHGRVQPGTSVNDCSPRTCHRRSVNISEHASEQTTRASHLGDVWS